MHMHLHIHTCIHLHTPTYTYIHTHIYICVYVCVCVYVYVCMYVCAHRRDESFVHFEPFDNTTMPPSLRSTSAQRIPRLEKCSRVRQPGLPHIFVKNQTKSQLSGSVRVRFGLPETRFSPPGLGETHIRQKCRSALSGSVRIRPEARLKEALGESPFSGPATVRRLYY